MQVVGKIEIVNTVAKKIEETNKNIAKKVIDYNNIKPIVLDLLIHIFLIHAFSSNNHS